MCICNVPCKKKIICTSIWGYFFQIRKGIPLYHNKQIFQQLAFRHSYCKFLLLQVLNSTILLFCIKLGEYKIVNVELFSLFLIPGNSKLSENIGKMLDSMKDASHTCTHILIPRIWIRNLQYYSTLAASRTLPVTENPFTWNTSLNINGLKCRE